MALAVAVVCTGTALAQTARTACTAQDAAALVARAEVAARDGDQQSAFRQLSTAAACGHADAQLRVGLMHAVGKGTRRDDTAAHKWLLTAAGQGLVAAQVSVAILYRTGRGVVRNDAEARRWYLAAATQGDAEAQYRIGATHASGTGVAKDLGEAVQWWHKAALQGHAVSQALVANLHMRLYYVGRDPDDAKAAYFWSILVERACRPQPPPALREPDIGPSALQADTEKKRVEVLCTGDQPRLRSLPFDVLTDPDRTETGVRARTWKIGASAPEPPSPAAVRAMPATQLPAPFSPNDMWEAPSPEPPTSRPAVARIEHHVLDRWMMQSGGSPHARTSSLAILLTVKEQKPEITVRVVCPARSKDGPYLQISGALFPDGALTTGVPMPLKDDGKSRLLAVAVNGSKVLGATDGRYVFVHFEPRAKLGLRAPDADFSRERSRLDRTVLTSDSGTLRISVDPNAAKEIVVRPSHLHTDPKIASGINTLRSRGLVPARFDEVLLACAGHVQEP